VWNVSRCWFRASNTRPSGPCCLPGVWLTPPLRDSLLADDLRRSAKPYLLVGSRADPSWEPVEARHVFEAADADHNMEVPGDPVRSAGLLRDVTAAMDAFVRDLQ
jgi:hypothetical protein